MKKIFLTSGLVLCMACPAFADNITNNSSCTEGTLGVSAQGSTAAIEALWEPITYTVTVDSRRYTSNSDQNPVAADTASTPTTVYVKYANGVYSTSADATSGTNALTGLVAPVMTGYTFAGFYDTPATGGNQVTSSTVVSGSSAFETDADTRVDTTQQGPTYTGTWYARWTVNSHSITYTCGSEPTGATTTLDTNGVAPSPQSNIAYGTTNVALAPTAGTCALDGYHFGGWRCSHNIADGTPTSNGTEYASSLVNDVYTVSTSLTFNTDADVTCDAIWVPNSITLTWYNGDTVHDTNACTYDDTISVPATEPTKTGYTFNGWQIKE